MIRPETEATSASSFVERELRLDPRLSYARLRERAAQQGMNIPPFLYGSTRRRLGLGAPEAGHGESETPVPAGLSERADGFGGRRAEREALEAPVDSQDERSLDEQPEQHEQHEQHAEDEQDSGGAPRPEAKKPAGQTPFEFAVEALRMSPEATFQDLKARASLAGLKLQPIVYGRAKAWLGLVPTKPRKPRAPRSLRQVESAAQLPPVQAAGGLHSIEQLAVAVRALEQERQHLRSLLQQVLDCVDEALAGDQGR